MPLLPYFLLASEDALYLTYPASCQLLNIFWALLGQIKTGPYLKALFAPDGISTIEKYYVSVFPSLVNTECFRLNYTGMLVSVRRGFYTAGVLFRKSQAQF